ncbi:unnamed protein product [Moneuplotes crassus]|uniref:Uncharacterized protein n=1 Tax=Euplotes crassus TaxID=5936 RepID=A0AAD1Y2F2_EUPCR|nr:unnamed protein product [Moneuplotes crassus]
MKNFGRKYDVMVVDASMDVDQGLGTEGKLVQGMRGLGCKYGVLYFQVKGREKSGSGDLGEKEIKGGGELGKRVEECVGVQYLLFLLGQFCAQGMRIVVFSENRHLFDTNFLEQLQHKASKCSTPSIAQFSISKLGTFLKASPPSSIKTISKILKQTSNLSMTTKDSPPPTHLTKIQEESKHEEAKIPEEPKQEGAKIPSLPSLKTTHQASAPDLCTFCKRPDNLPPYSETFSDPPTEDTSNLNPPQRRVCKLRGHSEFYKVHKNLLNKVIKLAKNGNITSLKGFMNSLDNNVGQHFNKSIKHSNCNLKPEDKENYKICVRNYLVNNRMICCDILKLLCQTHPEWTNKQVLNACNVVICTEQLENAAEFLGND